MDYPHDLHEGSAKTGFGSIHYRLRIGEGRRIVLLHGLGATGKVWLRMLGYLPKDAEVCMVDLLGHGKSDAPMIQYTVDVQARAIGEVVEALGYDNVCVVGHSYGGWVAAHYAAMKNAGSLVLIDSAGLKEELDDVINGEAPEARRDAITKAIMQTNSNKEYVIRSVFDNSVNFQLDAGALSMIGCPTLVIWGADDRMIPLSYGRMFGERIRGSTLMVVDGAGHEPHYSKAEDVGRMISDFIGRGK